jgi:cysteine desulfurase / selenocysteine lyase
MSIHAFGAALGLLLEAGIGNIENRVMKLGDCIIAELNRRDIKIYSSTISEERSGNISFNLNKDVDTLYSFMLVNKVKLTVRDGLVRLSPYFYDNEGEILKFFDLLDGFLKK